MQNSETSAFCFAGCKTSGLKSDILGLSAVWRATLQEVADKVVFDSSTDKLPVGEAQCLAADQMQEPGTRKEAG